MAKSKALSLAKLPDEDMVPIPGLPGYFATRSGRLFSVKELSAFMHSDGYLRFCAYGRKKRRRIGVHQVLALTFVPNPTGLREVRHLDGNKANNTVENLAWGTRADNAQDMARHGTVRGEKAHKAILTEAQVREIRRRYAQGGATQKYLAEAYGVKEPTIASIVSGRNWRHVK